MKTIRKEFVDRPTECIISLIRIAIDRVWNCDCLWRQCLYKCTEWDQESRERYWDVAALLDWVLIRRTLVTVSPSRSLLYGQQILEIKGCSILFFRELIEQKVAFHTQKSPSLRPFRQQQIFSYFFFQFEEESKPRWGRIKEVTFELHLKYLRHLCEVESEPECMNSCTVVWYEAMHLVGNWNTNLKKIKGTLSQKVQVLHLSIVLFMWWEECWKSTTSLWLFCWNVKEIHKYRTSIFNWNS